MLSWGPPRANSLTQNVVLYTVNFTRRFTLHLHTHMSIHTREVHTYTLIYGVKVRTQQLLKSHKLKLLYITQNRNNDDIQAIIITL